MKRDVARRVRCCFEEKLQKQTRHQKHAGATTINQVMKRTGAVRRKRDGDRTLAVLIDCADAFHSVDRGCIVEELLSVGAGNHLVDKIRSLLQHRRAQVRVNTGVPEDITLTYGDPHGSVIEPLLFVVTVASLKSRRECIPGNKHRFIADDLTIVCAKWEQGQVRLTIQQGLAWTENGSTR
ncbi:hypothetical protein TRVL_03664 [Trypanosoma vivax]|nr:hypothetical protein TRVL_03664 [Trypanosoma vivax]